MRHGYAGWIFAAAVASSERIRFTAPANRAPLVAAAVNRVQLADPSFPRATPHDCRPTAASLAISAGANVNAVQRMLGHASAAMTLDTYADLFDDDLDTVAVALDGARTVVVEVLSAGND